MNKINKLKKKLHDNQDWIFVGALVGGMIVLYTAAVALAIKQENAAVAGQAANRQTLIDAINAGKQILPNPDGSFWILDNK